MNVINSIPGQREPYPPTDESAIAEAAVATPVGANDALDAAIASREPLQNSGQAVLEHNVWEGRAPGQRLFSAAMVANRGPETATSADLDRYAAAVLAPISAR